MDFPASVAPFILRGVTLAGINSASGVTLAGSPAALSVIESHLQQQRVFCRRLALDYAFHSPAMDPIRGLSSDVD